MRWDFAFRQGWLWHQVVIARKTHNAAAAQIELERFLGDETRQPIMYSHYYTDNIQNARNEASKSLIEDSVRHAIRDDWNGTLHLDNTEKTVSNCWHPSRSV